MYVSILYGVHTYIICSAHFRFFHSFISYNFNFLQELPFLEYNLHSRLMNKVYVCGMNAVFGLKIQVSVGDTVITGLAVSGVK